MSIRLLALFCCLLCHSPAAETEMAGPVLGFFFDPRNGLQPIRGISGALTIGAPVDLKADVARVVISPQQDYALAATASNPDLLRVAIGDRISVELLGIPISGAGLIALSPTGSVAALHDRGRNRIQVIAGLRATATLMREFDLSTFPGVLASLAVSDTADTVLAGFSGVEQDAVVALGSDGTVRVLAAPRHATAATFLSRSREVLIADGPASEVYLVREPTGVADATLLAGEAQGVSEPIALAVSRDGKRAFVANSRSGEIAAIGLAGGATKITQCACNPSQLATLNGNAVFRLTEPSAGPMWLFDGDGDEPRIVFVPPYRPAAEDRVQ